MNTSYHESIKCTPFELHHGCVARTPVSPRNIFTEEELRAVCEEAAAKRPLDLVRASAEAFSTLAKDNSRHGQEQTALRLNFKGHKKIFEVGDRVMIYRPPTQPEATRRRRKLES